MILKPISHYSDCSISIDPNANNFDIVNTDGRVLDSRYISAEAKKQARYAFMDWLVETYESNHTLFAETVRRLHTDMQDNYGNDNETYEQVRLLIAGHLQDRESAPPRESYKIYDEYSLEAVFILTTTDPSEKLGSVRMDYDLLQGLPLQGSLTSVTLNIGLSEYDVTQEFIQERISSRIPTYLSKNITNILTMLLRRQLPVPEKLSEIIKTDDKFFEIVSHMLDLLALHTPYAPDYQHLEAALKTKDRVQVEEAIYANLNLLVSVLRIEVDVEPPSARQTNNVFASIMNMVEENVEYVKVALAPISLCVDKNEFVTWVARRGDLILTTSNSHETPPEDMLYWSYAFQSVANDERFVGRPEARLIGRLAKRMTDAYNLSLQGFDQLPFGLVAVNQAKCLAATLFNNTDRRLPHFTVVDENTIAVSFRNGEDKVIATITFHVDIPDEDEIERNRSEILGMPIATVLYPLSDTPIDIPLMETKCALRFYYTGYELPTSNTCVDWAILTSAVATMLELPKNTTEFYALTDDAAFDAVQKLLPILMLHTPCQPALEALDEIMTTRNRSQLDRFVSQYRTWLHHKLNSY